MKERFGKYSCPLKEMRQEDSSDFKNHFRMLPLPYGHILWSATTPPPHRIPLAHEKWNSELLTGIRATDMVVTSSVTIHLPLVSWRPLLECFCASYLRVSRRHSTGHTTTSPWIYNTPLKLLRKTLLSVSDNCVINLPKAIIFVWKYVWIADRKGWGMRIGDILKVKAHNYRHYSEHSLIVKWRLRPVCVLFWRRRMWNKWRETIHCGILPFRFHPEEWCREISGFAWIS